MSDYRSRVGPAFVLIEKNTMIIALASGKGGTGKTTISTSLAWTLAGDGRRLTLADCDVEEPNCHLFLMPQAITSKAVSVSVPYIDPNKCTNCGACSEVCRFNALACLPNKVVVAEELCHGCGACGLACPSGAISETARTVGKLETGRCGDFPLITGRLRVGEAMSSPLIRAVKAAAGNSDLVIVDAPPGTTCPVIAAVKGVDFVLLVTEPTPFGLNDLRLAVELVRQLQLPFAVAVNRSDIGDEGVRDYSRAEEIDILLEIPNDRRAAEAYSRGRVVAESCPQYQQRFRGLYEAISERVGK